MNMHLRSIHFARQGLALLRRLLSLGGPGAVRDANIYPPHKLVFPCPSRRLRRRHCVPLRFGLALLTLVAATLLAGQAQAQVSAIAASTTVSGNTVTVTWEGTETVADASSSMPGTARTINLPIDASMVMDGTNLKVVDVQIKTELTHSNIGDLRVMLVHPDGTMANLLDRLQGRMFGCYNDDLDVTFTDSASESLACKNSPMFGRTVATETGQFKPAQPLVMAADGTDGAFKDLLLVTSSARNWQLVVTDHERGNAGSVDKITLTIVTVPLPTLSIATAQTSEPEGAELVYTLTATGPLSASAAVSVPVNVTQSGNYLSGDAPGTVAFLANATSATLRLATQNDNTDEADGSVTVALAAPMPPLSYVLSATASELSASVAVTDNEGLPYLRSNSPEASFGDSHLRFVVSLEAREPPAQGETPGRVTDKEVTLGYGGSAQGEVFGAGRGTLTFQPGAATATVSVEISASAPPTQDIPYRLNWFGADNAELTGLDGDFYNEGRLLAEAPLPLIGIAAGADAVAEGGSVGFTVTLGAAPAAALTVPITVGASDGIAFTTAGLTGDGGLVFSSGQSVARFSVAITEDQDDEPDGGLEAALGAAPDGYALDPDAARASIRVTDNDDPPAVVSTAQTGNTVTVTWSGETPIPDNAPGGIALDLPVVGDAVAAADLDGLVVTEVRVSANIPHSYVRDLAVTLRHPGGATARLFNQLGCGSEAQDLDVTWADGGSPLACRDTSPAGDVMPVEPLAAAFSGLPLTAGDAHNWQLLVSDNAGDDTGSVTSITLTITTIQLPSIRLATTDSDSLIEEGEGAGFIVTLGAAPDAALTVPITVDAPDHIAFTTPGLTGSGNDMLMLAFAMGASTATFSVIASEDMEAGGGGSISVSLGRAPVGYVNASNADSVAITVRDNDATQVSVAFPPGGSSVVEGQGAVFTVTRGDSPGTSGAPLVLTLAVTATGQMGAASGNITVTLAANQLAATLTVATVGDDIDEEHGSVTLSLVAVPDGYLLGQASATVEVRDDDAEGLSVEDAQRLNRAALPYIALAYADQTTGAIRARMDSVFQGRAPVQGLTLNGQRAGHFLHSLLPAQWSSADQGPAMALTDLAFALSAARDGEGDGQVTLWGRGFRDRMDVEGDAFGFKGDLTGALVGFDVPNALPGLVLGLGFSNASAELDFTQKDYGGQAKEGIHETDLRGLHPYFGWQLNEDANVWGAMSLAKGDIVAAYNSQLEAGRVGPYQDDIDLHSLSFGGQNRFRQLGSADGGSTSLGVIGDGLYSSISGSGPGAPRVSAARVRLGLEVDYARTLDTGALLGASMEMTARHDFGDLQHGLGMELGGSLDFAIPSIGLRLDLRARGLLFHEADVAGWGISGGITWTPGVNGRGLALTLRPEWGAVASQSAALWKAPTLAATPALPNASEAPSLRYTLEMTYGIPISQGADLLTVFVRGNPQAETTAYRLGANFNLGPHFSAVLETPLNDAPHTPAAEQSAYLRYQRRF